MKIEDLKKGEIYYATKNNDYVLATVTYSDLDGGDSLHQDWTVQGKVIKSNFYRSTYHNMHKGHGMKIKKVSKEAHPEYWL